MKSETDDSNKCVRCVLITKSLHVPILSNNNIDIKHFTKSFEVIQSGHEIICLPPSGYISWKKSEYVEWSIHTCHTIGTILFTIHSVRWKVSPVHIHRIKSYAPHVDHVVVDIKCVPAEIY